jgi:hypothetical protein
MPEKQTRESIEAELHAGERERLAQQLRELMHDQNETERMFRELEDAAGLPTSQRSKPMTERMAALGMSQAVIDHVEMMQAAITTIKSGRQDELPNQLKNELAGQADAELSGAEQLAAIVDQQRKG